MGENVLAQNHLARESLLDDLRFRLVLQFKPGMFGATNHFVIRHQLALSQLEDMPTTFGQVLKEEEGTVIEPIWQKMVANFSIRAPPDGYGRAQYPSLNLPTAWASVQGACAKRAHPRKP